MCGGWELKLVERRGLERCRGVVRQARGFDDDGCFGYLVGVEIRGLRTRFRERRGRESEGHSRPSRKEVCRVTTFL